MTKTARKKLGEVITFHLRQRSMDDRSASDRCGVSVKIVENWKSGEVVPSGSEWKRLCQLVSKGLFGAAGLHHDALKEQDEERDAMVRRLQHNGHTTTSVNGAVVTNFGDKLVQSQASRPEPTPAPDDVADAIVPVKERKNYPVHPVGTRMASAVHERREYARSILIQRPKISFRGPDGLRELLVKRYGAGIAEPEYKRLLEEIETERVERVISARLAAVQQETPARVRPVMLPPPQVKEVPVETPPVKDADVSAGVELIIGAIPGLQEMTIKIDDAGVASVSYSVRKVQVTTVSSSLTVRR